MLTDLWMPLLLLIGWSSSTGLIGSIDLSHCPIGTLTILLAVRTFLQTGLFVTAHDAIHGTVWPDRPAMNQLIGRLCVMLYALLPYDLLYINHQLHHLYPATERDPDFCASPFWLWYLRFIGSYLRGMWGRWLLRIISLMTTLALWGWPIENLLLLWLLPVFLSSLQLFYFGTFVPHRAELVSHRSNQLQGHSARSSSLPVFGSLLTCYHFGYHQEHHDYPHLPWYQLPIVKQM